jgi:diaminohydroxyphosphoribosylaminopyrimidine deaminase/5-amino-6-(5-phosphoribosylamino)uracil reductase
MEQAARATGDMIREDMNHMRSALALARRGLGGTWPNPSVGCVIVRNGRVVGRAVTAPGGRPHAERLALAMAGEEARGATVYVTLEPCCHWGRTPPCTDALIEAGVARVVIAVRDPDPRVNGQGVARLRSARIAVEEGVLAAEAERVLAGFTSRLRRSRPLVTLKLASTLDGRIATHAGESQWITGEAARRAAHAMRGQADAVLVGVGTVLADNPELTCRIPGYRSTPIVRVIADSHLRTPLTSKLIRTAASSPTWFLVRPGADPDRRAALADLGVKLIDVAAGTTGIDLADGLRTLAKAGITRLLVEGGGQIAASLLRADLVDGIAWFHAPAVMGGDGWPAAQAFGIDRLAAMPRFVRHGVTALGTDMLTEFERAA